MDKHSSELSQCSVKTEAQVETSFWVGEHVHRDPQHLVAWSVTGWPEAMSPPAVSGA